MGIAAQVLEYLCRSSHGCLAVDDPVLGGGLPQQAPPESSADAGAVRNEGLLEALEELAAKDLGELAHRHEEVGPGRGPAIVGTAQSTPRHDAMDVRMKCQGLSPGVQHGNRTGDHSQLPFAHRVDRSKGGPEKQLVALASFRQEERVQRLRHCEDQMEVRYRKQAPALGIDPTCLLQALALGTVTVTAGVVERLFAATLVAHLEVTAQGGCSALHDVSDHPTAIAAELLQGRSMRPEDVRQLRRAAHRGRQGLSRRARLQRIQWTACPPQIVARNVDVALRRA